MDAAFDKFSERFFLAEQGKIFRVGFDFFQHLSFFFGGEFIVQKQVHALQKILAVLKVVHRKKFLVTAPQ